MESLFRGTGKKGQAVEIKKTSHKKQIIKYIYFNGPQSNSDLANSIKLSTPKINSLLLELIDEGIVNDLGRGDSSGGRRPNIYGLVEDAFYVAGIVINTNRTIISIFNSNNVEVGNPHYFPIRIEPNIRIFEQVKESLELVLKETGIDRRKILVAGVELPGLTNQKQGVNRTYFPNVKNLSEEIKKMLGMQVVFEHDTKVRTFAEQHFGLAKNRKNVLVLLADWGLGLGIIIDGKLYPGKSGYSGEFGHVPIIEDGILCKCGKQGCLETVVSATAIVKTAKEGYKNGKSSLLWQIVENETDKIDITSVIQAANSGDQFAISLFAEVGKWMGRGIAFLVQIFNPELIIIGGRISEAGQFVSAPIQHSLNIYSNHDISNDTEIKFSELGLMAGTIGVAAYALDKITLKNNS
jgi:predicted NBD/HSP70 family sugar kinase